MVRLKINKINSSGAMLKLVGRKGSIIKCLFLSPFNALAPVQYGFVNYALELLVLKNFGLEIWEKIKWVIKVSLKVLRDAMP